MANWHFGPLARRHWPQYGHGHPSCSTASTMCYDGMCPCPFDFGTIYTPTTWSWTHHHSCSWSSWWHDQTWGIFPTQHHDGAQCLAIGWNVHLLSSSTLCSSTWSPTLWTCWLGWNSKSCESCHSYPASHHAHGGGWSHGAHAKAKHKMATSDSSWGRTCYVVHCSTMCPFRLQSGSSRIQPDGPESEHNVWRDPRITPTLAQDRL